MRELLDMMAAAHGVRPGDSCAGCGHAWSAEDLQGLPDRCPSCLRPLPERCRADCGNLLQPAQDADRWARPDRFCASCRLMLRLQAAGVPDELVAAAADYQRHRWRLPALSALARWVDGEHAATYLHGNVGAGKSVLLALTVRQVLEAEPGTVACWTTEAELLDAAKARYDREDRRPRVLIERAQDADVLVIDELFSRPGGWSEYSARTLSDLIARRLERGQRLLVASNRPPAWAEVLDTRVESRWAACGVVAEVMGPDLRRRAAA